MKRGETEAVGIINYQQASRGNINSDLYNSCCNKDWFLIFEEGAIYFFLLFFLYSSMKKLNLVLSVSFREIPEYGNSRGRRSLLCSFFNLRSNNKHLPMSGNCFLYGLINNRIGGTDNACFHIS